MKESKAIYVTKKDIRDDQHRDYQVYVDSVLSYSNLEHKYVLTNDVGVQHNSRKDVIWNLAELRKKHDARYLSVTPRQIYTYHKTRSFTEIGVGSIKALPKKKVKKIYLPETDDRGVGSNDLVTLNRKPKPSRFLSYYDQKRTSSKCVGGEVKADVKNVVSATVSPIIQMKCEFTSPRDSVLTFKDEAKTLVTTTTQFEHQVVEESIRKDASLQEFLVKDPKPPLVKVIVRDTSKDSPREGSIKQPSVTASVKETLIKQGSLKEPSIKGSFRETIVRDREGSIKDQKLPAKEQIREGSVKQPLREESREVTSTEPEQSTREPSTREPSIWEPSTREPSTREPSLTKPSTGESIRQPSFRDTKFREPIGEPRKGSIRDPKKDTMSRGPSIKEPVKKVKDKEPIRKAKHHAGEPVLEVIKPSAKGADNAKDAVFSSDSLVQHIHNLDLSNDYKQAGDLMENKLEREYRKMFVPSKSREIDKPPINSIPKKSTSLLRRRFTALRRSLGKKESKKSSSGVGLKDSTETTNPSVKDASISSDPPSLEERSFSNASNSPSYHSKSPFQSRKKRSKQSFKKPYTEISEEEDQNWSQAIDSEYASGVKGMFKLWGKKFNLDDDPRKYEIVAAKPIKKKPDYKTPLKIETKPKPDEEDKSKDKKKGKLSFFKRKLSSKDKKKETYKKKDSVTTGRCEVKEGLVLKIGAGNSPCESTKKRDPESYEDIKRTDWLLKYLNPHQESKKSLKLRWNNKMYTTSSSTVFELVQNVYKNPVAMVSQSETLTSSESYEDDVYGKYKYQNTRNVNFVQNIEAWMIPQTIPDQNSPLPNFFDSKTDENDDSSNQKYSIDKSKAFARKIELVLRTNNFVRLQNNRDSSGCLRIHIPRGYLSDTSNDDLQQTQTSDEEVYQIVEYETSSITDYVPEKMKSKNTYTSDHGVKITINLNDEFKDSKKVDTVIKQPPVQKDKLVQGSSVYVPNKCDVIGVGIITQRNTRETGRPILKIVEYFSDDDSERSSQKVVKKCEFAERYLQDYYKHYQPLGMDLFSWCVSDSHLKCCSDDSKCHHICGTKSCPNMYDNYITMMSSCCPSSGSQICPLDRDSSFKKDAFCRVLPKDSLEVLKKRKLYATEKAKWGSERGETYSTPSNEERGVQNSWGNRKPCFSLNTNTKSSYHKNIPMPEYEDIYPMKGEGRAPPVVNEQGHIVPGILILGGCKKGQTAPPKQLRLATKASEITTPENKCVCPPYPHERPSRCSMKTSLDWSPIFPHTLQKTDYDLVLKSPARQRCTDLPPKQDQDRTSVSSRSSKCRTMSISSSGTPTKVLSWADTSNNRPPSPKTSPRVPAFPPEKYGEKPQRAKPPYSFDAPQIIPLPRSSEPQSPLEAFMQEALSPEPIISNEDTVNVTYPVSPKIITPQLSPRSSSPQPEGNFITRIASKFNIYYPKLPVRDAGPATECGPPQPPKSRSQTRERPERKRSDLTPHNQSTPVRSRSSPQDSPPHSKRPRSSIPIVYRPQRPSSQQPLRPPVVLSSMDCDHVCELPPCCIPEPIMISSTSFKCPSPSTCKPPFKPQRIVPGLNSVVSREIITTDQKSEKCYSPEECKQPCQIPHTQGPCRPGSCRNMYSEPNETWHISHQPSNPAAMSSLHAPIIRKSSIDTIDSPELKEPPLKSPARSLQSMLATNAQEFKPKSQEDVFIDDKKSQISALSLEREESKRDSAGLTVRTAYTKSSEQFRQDDNIKFKDQRGSSNKILSHKFKITDNTGETLVERKDYGKETRDDASHSHQLPLIYKISKTKTSSIPINQIDLQETKSDTSVANIIEINFQLKVIQGDNTTQINIREDNSKLSNEKASKGERKEVLILDKGLGGDVEVNPKSDVNIRILIKSFKPKTNGVNTHKTMDEFAQQISKKFDTVSTGRSAILRHMDADTNLSVHTANVEVSEAIEKHYIEEVVEHHFIDHVHSREIKTHQLSEHLSTHVDFSPEDDKLYLQPDDKRDLPGDEDKSVTDGKLTDGTATAATEKTMTSDTTKGIRKNLARMFKSVTDTDESIPLKSSDDPTDIGLKTSDEPIGSDFSGTSESDRAATTSGGTSHDQIKRHSLRDENEEQIHTNDDTKVNNYIELKKSKKEEKKEMLKQVFEHADYLKKPKTKNRMRKIKDMLRAILTSESEPADSDGDCPMVIVDNELATEVTYGSFKPNYFKNSDSLNNYYQIDEVNSRNAVSNLRRTHPSSVNMVSEKQSVWSQNEKKNNCCVCTTFARRLSINEGGGCCCRKPEHPKSDMETYCDLLGELEEDCSMEKQCGCVEVQTQVPLENNTNFTQVCFGVNTAINETHEVKKPETFKESFTLSKLFEPRPSHLKPCQLKKISTDTKLGISPEDKIVIVESKMTKTEKTELKSQSAFKSGADILQMYETKKAVLEIYAQKTVTKDGVSRVVAKLPKFAYNKEQEIYRNYEQLRKRPYGKFKSNNYFMI